MESWFFADKDKLAEFYGQNFKRNSLAKNTNVEKIPKASVVVAVAAGPTRPRNCGVPKRTDVAVEGRWRHSCVAVP